MNTSELAAALRKISEGVWDLSAAIESSGPARPAGGAEAASASPSVSSAPTFSDGMPVEEPPLFPGAFEGEEMPITQPPYRPPAPTEQDRILAECPVHFKPWTIKEGGMSKAGKPYSAFWKCSARNDDDSYCDKKPTKEWVKTHDPEKALAAA